MKFVNINALVATVLSLSLSCLAYGGNELSYEDTVKLISKTMDDNTSDARKEHYAYIKFDNCVLQYKVSGTFPVGTLYDIKFSNIDFSSLNEHQSKVDHDYTDFLLLNFRNPAKYEIDGADIPIHTVIINTSDGESAKTLFNAFLHLGKLCGAKGLL